jgi:hypothetical protein
MAALGIGGGRIWLGGTLALYIGSRGHMTGDASRQVRGGLPGAAPHGGGHDRVFHAIKPDDTRVKLEAVINRTASDI